MKIDIDELSPVQRKVRVELPAETVADEFTRAYKNLGQRVRVKGFRSGKIPRSVLRGIYGDEVISEVRSHLVEESLGEVIKERSMQIVSRPDVEANDIREGDGFSFSAVFEIKPEIEVKDYLGVEVEKVKLAVTEDQVGAALARLQESHASLALVSDREIVQKGDYVTLDFDGTIEGKPFSGGKGENYLLEVGGGHALPQFEDAVVGLRIGERQAVQVVYPETYPNKEITGKTVDFFITAREIKQKVLPALDDEFAKDNGEHSSLEELKATIRKRLEDELLHYQTEQLKEQLLNRIIEAQPVTIPPSMIERQTRYLMERYQNQMTPQMTSESEPMAPMEEARKTLEGRAKRQVHATLLVERIAQLEKIAIDEKAIQERVDHLARTAGDRSKAVRDFYARPESRDDLRAQMIFDQTLNFLVERAKINEIDPPLSVVDEDAEKS